MAPKRTRSNTYKRYCCAFGCLNKRKNSDQGLTFFTIPQEIERRREWLKAIDREDLLDENINKAKNNFICCAHFDDSSMITTISKRLKSGAVPTKVLPRRTERDPLQIEPDPPGEIAKVSTYSHAQIQTDDPHKHTLAEDTDAERDIAKPTEDKSLNKLKKKSTVQTEPTTSTAQTETLTCTSTQTDFNETSNIMTQTTLEFSDESSKRKIEKDIEIVKCKRKKL